MAATKSGIMTCFHSTKRLVAWQPNFPPSPSPTSSVQRITLPTPLPTRRWTNESKHMNRTDRLLAIILELQGKGRQRAEDLAATFETSKRTIYRDIQALGEAGVPVVSIPGLGYSLMKGYFLPPLSFSTDEATMLILGSDLMAQ